MQYTFFFHLSSAFSNFHPSKITYKDYTFISNEQFIMFSKARNFNDEQSAKRIMDINAHPLVQDFIAGQVSRTEIVASREMSEVWNSLMKEIKKLGRGVKNYDDKFWVEKRASVAIFGAKLKFGQNSDLKDLLVATGGTVMVEASPWDKIWGIGLSKTDAQKTAAEDWPGENLLGKILTHVRDKFFIENFIEKTIDKKDIEVLNFYLIGKQIPEDGVYLARYNKNFNLPGSKFANPFPINNQTEGERTRVIAQYTQWMWQQIASGAITKQDLLALQGKKLVCYCAPKACHAHVVKDTVELLVRNEAEFDAVADKYRSNHSRHKI